MVCSGRGNTETYSNNQDDHANGYNGCYKQHISKTEFNAIQPEKIHLRILHCFPKQEVKNTV